MAPPGRQPPPESSRAPKLQHAELDREAGRLPDGRTYNTCPSAGICRQVCYARHGTYTWPRSVPEWLHRT
ncbi:hypothetical protein AB0M05_38705 [Streptomyces violaceusniger]